MTKIAETLQTALDCDAAFAYVADFSRQAEWDPNTVSSERIDDGPLGEGARFALDVKIGRKVAPMEYRISEFSAPNKIVLIGEGSGVWTEDTITFDQNADGTRIQYIAEIKLSGLLGLVQPLLGRAFEAIGKGAVAGMQRELDKLAAASAPAASKNGS